jgi:N-acetylneuraminate synthase
MKIKIGKKVISEKSKTYFIADIGANHDGSLTRAKKLIQLCAKAGADAAKFQHFKANTIVSDYGFKKIGKITHQKNWNKSVFQVYKNASINNKWTKLLKKECDKYKIDFMTSPYDLHYVDSVNKYIKAYKIGSGDITWKEIIIKIAKKKLPLILATGASSLIEVKNAVNLITKYKKKFILMQCNTNYTNDIKNFNYLNINVLKTFKKIFKSKIILGLSDHTQGHSAVISAVTLGARVVEKHFTDNNYRSGPDHAFAMNPKTWKTMVDETRKIEKALGNGEKIIEKNEIQSSIVQRRCIRVNRDLKINHKIKKKDLVFLRPAPKNSISPFNFEKIINKKLKKSIKAGDCISWNKIK